MHGTNVEEKTVQTTVKFKTNCYKIYGICWLNILVVSTAYHWGTGSVLVRLGYLAPW